MIIVDKTLYTEQDLLSRFAELSRMDEFRNPEGVLYALCLKHSYDLLSVLLYVRERGGSVLLIHADTPLETAKQMAGQANSKYLLYEDVTTVVSISERQRWSKPSLCQYSSGTTGEPKLISRPWQTISEEVEHYNRRLQSSPDEQPLILVPVSHSFGLIAGVLTALARGAIPIIIQDNNPKFALNAITTTYKSIVYGVPFLFHIMESLGRGALRFHKLVSSGAPLSEMLLQRLERCTGEIWQQYGCTELGCMTLGSRPATPYDVGSPLPHMQISTIGHTDSDGRWSQAGEIVALCNGTEVHTRDIGYVTDAGVIRLLGRMDDVINVSGFKVIPSEIEDVLGRMPGITEAVVYKSKHKVWGEAVHAQVVLSRDIQESDMKAWCRERLPAFKVPAAIEAVKEIMRLPSGKISRKILEERMWMMNG